jgi:hypothetical protein
VFDYPSAADIGAFLSDLLPPSAATSAQPPPASAAPAISAAAAGDEGAAAAAAAAASLLVQATVGDLLGLAPAEGAALAADEPLMAAGLNSSLAVVLTGRLEERLGVPLPPTLVGGARNLSIGGESTGRQRSVCFSTFDTVY